MKMNIRTWFKIVLMIIWIGSAGMFIAYLIQTKENRDANALAQQLAMEKQEQLLQEKLQEQLEQQDALRESEEQASREQTAREAAERAAAEAVKEGLVEVRYWRELPVEDDSYMETLEKNLESLREINEDVLGWIVIPDTQLDYPLMRGEDNDYYLERSWEGEPNVAGSIFMEQVNDREFKHFNTVIYGHRMKDGSMFGSLKHYSGKSYWEKHPYIYICDDGGVHRYEIFAAYEATLEGSTYQVGFADDESKQIFLDNCVGYSDIDTGVIPTIEDRIITLSTCTGRGYDSRWVVQARRRGEILVELEPKPEQ